MQFANPLPWWLAVLVAAAVAAVAWWTYRVPIAPLTRTQRGVLVGLRGLSLGALVIVLCRPVVLVPAPAADIVVPLLVDVSRSMQVADADGETRAAQAARLVEGLWPALSGRFKPELFAVGEGVTSTTPDRLHADDRRSDLEGALESVRARYRGRQIPGIVLLSDGGSTGGMTADGPGEPGGPPVYAIGLGSTSVRDREIVGVVAGDPRLDQASVDLQVTAVSHGFGREPFEIRVSADGAVIESRTVAPAVDGSPANELFTVSPDPVAGTVYTVSISPDAGEMVTGNNTMSTLVNPAGRARRVLALLGAPGYDHSFLLRALNRDPGLEIDTSVRKGRDETGRETFLIQAAAGRSRALGDGFPGSREALFAYDALVLGNIEGDSLTRAQLALVADFVASRGGGLVVFGARSFATRGFINTPLEDVLPLELDDRRGGFRREAVDAESAGAQYTVALTSDGLRHPVMRLGASPSETSRRWTLVPPLAAAAALGAPRAGATVLAITTTPNGGVAPLVAVQRYGRGRSLVFTGEASWRWRMLLPSDDRTYESFWRQVARWAAAPAPDPVSIDVPGAPELDETVEVVIDVRDAEFRGASGATVNATVTGPGGQAETLTLRADPATAGRFVAAFRPAQSGLYGLRAEAHAAGAALGAADRLLLVGGADRELADPRMNAGYLQRLARASGGELLTADQAASLPDRLQVVSTRTAPPVYEDLWHRPWTFALVALLLSAEWALRRRWGLR